MNRKDTKKRRNKAMNPEQKTFVVPNIGCDHCVHTITEELSQLEGIQNVKGDVQSKVVTVQWVAPATWGKIEEKLDEIEYPPERTLMP
jgi:copper chaperone CopZ